MNSETFCSCGRELYPYIPELLSLGKNDSKLINYSVNNDNIKDFLDKYKFLICCRVHLRTLVQISDQVKI